MHKIDITIEKRMRVCKEFIVTEEELEALKNGENPFYEEMEKDITSGSEEWDYAVNDENGNTIVDWE